MTHRQHWSCVSLVELGLTGVTQVIWESRLHTIMYRNGCWSGIFSELEFSLTGFMTPVPTFPSLHQFAFTHVKKSYLGRSGRAAQTVRVVGKWNEADLIPRARFNIQNLDLVEYFTDCSYFGLFLNTWVKEWVLL